MAIGNRAWGARAICAAAASLAATVVAPATSAGGADRPPVEQQQTPPVAYASSCSALNGVAVRRLLVSEVLRFDAGEYVPSPDAARRDAAGLLRRLPEFCRLIATPGPKGIGLATVEVWLPTRTWNGRLVALGPDVLSGAPDYLAMADGVSGGHGVVSLHRPGRGATPVPAAREMVLAAGDLTLFYFGRGPRNVYWSGCGANARLGLQLANEDPGAIDGLVAISPFAAETAAPVHDLRPFLARGGKLLLFQSGRAAIDAFTAITRALPPAQSAARLFAGASAPSCASSDASSLPAVLTVMIEWIETGRAPDRVAIAATAPPVCAYPRVAAYGGRGDMADVRNYVCREAK